MLTDADLTVNSTIYQIFNLSYPIHYTYHIIQNFKNFLKIFMIIIIVIVKMNLNSSLISFYILIRLYKII